MIRRNTTKKQDRSKGGNRPGGVMASVFVLICAATLGSGFFFAARQHFSSMDFGMKNSRLRKQIEQLEAEKRRLILAREISLSPSELKKAAKKVGLMDQPIQAAPMITSADPVEAKAAGVKNIADKPLIERTASVVAIPPIAAAVLKKAPKTDKAVKDQTRP